MEKGSVEVSGGGGRRGGVLDYLPSCSGGKQSMVTQNREDGSMLRFVVFISFAKVLYINPYVQYKFNAMQPFSIQRQTQVDSIHYHHHPPTPTPRFIEQPHSATQRPTVRGRERAIVNQTNIETASKRQNRARGGARTGLPERVDPSLSLIHI